MNLKEIVLIVIALFANIGIINAEQISIPSVSTPLGAKLLNLIEYNLKKLCLIWKVKLRAKQNYLMLLCPLLKTFNEQMLLHREVESRMHAHIEEHNRTIRSVTTTRPY